MVAKAGPIVNRSMNVMGKNAIFEMTDVFSCKLDVPKTEDNLVLVTDILLNTNSSKYGWKDESEGKDYWTDRLLLIYILVRECNSCILNIVQPK